MLFGKELTASIVAEAKSGATSSRRWTARLLLATALVATVVFSAVCAVQVFHGLLMIGAAS